MIVTRENFEHTLNWLHSRSELAIDTETTGLRPYHGHEFFSIIICDGEQSYYFNFNDYPDLDPEHNLETPEHRLELQYLLGDPERIWYLHNAKYDMAIFRAAGWHLGGHIHCTMAVARLLKSDLNVWQFSLEECAAEIGHKKGDVVKFWLEKTGGFTEHRVPGTKAKKKNYHFSLAPWDLIVPYGEQDGMITWALAKHQQSQLKKLSKEMAFHQMPETVQKVYANEMALTRTSFEMEAHGVMIDREYCTQAIAHNEQLLLTTSKAFEQNSGHPFKDSSKLCAVVFGCDRQWWVKGEETKTGKVNYKFDAEVLETFTHPAARNLLDWKRAKSDINYYHGFLYHADAHDTIHSNFNQHGAATGRSSSSSPNLQNLTKIEAEDLADHAYPVRRAIVPRPGMVFHMLDYDQMEYRLMLGYAARYAGRNTDGVLALIKMVLDGLDVHQATANSAGLTRSRAKMVNFSIIYGSGIAALARKLKVSEPSAKIIRGSVLNAAPEIDILINRVKLSIEKRGFIVNWLGRMYNFPDTRFAYKGTNYLIQGGCADIVKIAMNRVHQYLKPFRTRMVLMVHDELVLEGPPEEACTVVPEVRRIMQTVYPHRFIPLTCGVDHSYKSLADKVEGIAT